MMRLVSDQIHEFQRSSSWIRRMFEAGIELRKRFGAENVYDFSLGNPDLEPPRAVLAALRRLPEELDRPAGLGYMPNAGYPEAREALAGWLSRQQESPVRGSDLVLTVGAAGAINALLRAILSPGDEVLCPAPYFVEYGFYCGNHGSRLVPVRSRPLTFELDIPALEAAVNGRTRAVIINSPNNPSGAVYREEQLRELSEVLRRASARNGRPVFLIADEPYRFLAYDGVRVPAVFPLYEASVIVSSFSKNLSLAGERIGYAAVNPRLEGREELVAGLILTNRILGFVNAPCIGQRLMQACLDVVPDTAVYEERRSLMAGVLDAAGIRYRMPAGTFYFFPEVPGGLDDVGFVSLLQEERILAVPGSGFGYPGFFRLALCVDKRFIAGAGEGFRRAAEAARRRK